MFPKSFWFKDKYWFQESGPSVSQLRELPIRNVINWRGYTKPGALWWFSLATSCHLVLTRLWKLGRRPQCSVLHLHQRWGHSCPSGDGLWWAVSSTGSCASAVVLPAFRLGLPAALEDTLHPSTGAGWAISFLLCILSAVCWVSAVSSVQSTMRDFDMVSSEKCLMLPRPIFCIEACLSI